MVFTVFVVFLNLFGFVLLMLFENNILQITTVDALPFLNFRSDFFRNDFLGATLSLFSPVRCAKKKTQALQVVALDPNGDGEPHCSRKSMPVLETMNFCFIFPSLPESFSTKIE